MEEVVVDWRRLHSEGFITVCFTNYYSDQIKDKMHRACTMHQKNEKRIQNFGWKT
jgi:hypothetical protein